MPVPDNKTPLIIQPVENGFLVKIPQRGDRQFEPEYAFVFGKAVDLAEWIERWAESDSREVNPLLLACPLMRVRLSPFGGWEAYGDGKKYRGDTPEQAVNRLYNAIHGVTR